VLAGVLVCLVFQQVEVARNCKQFVNGGMISPLVPLALNALGYMVGLNVASHLK
jgi:hypothetical protein